MGAILRVGEKLEGKQYRERRKYGSKGGETVIIRVDIILRLEVSWGHAMSLLKYKVKEYQPAAL